MALFDPTDFGGSPDTGWLSQAFNSIPMQQQLDPNQGWGDVRRTGRPTAEMLDQWMQTPGMQPAPPAATGWDAPGQSMGYNLPTPGMPVQPQQMPQQSLPPQAPQMPPSGLPGAAMIPPVAPPSMPPPASGPIAQIAQKYGIDPALFQRVAQIESGDNPRNVTGSYKGLFQLSDSEFNKYGGGNIFNPVDNANAAARKLQAESKDFREKYGRDPSPTDLYMIHQQGPAGYAAHMSAPDRPAWQNMLSTGEGRDKGERWAKAAVWGNIPDQLKRQFGSVDNVTSAQFVDLWRNKVEGPNIGGGMAAGGPQSPGSDLPAPGAMPQQRGPQMPSIGGMAPIGRPPDIGDRLQAAGAGFFNAGSPMQAIGNLIGGAITGQRQDPTGIAAQMHGQNQQAVYTALKSQGASDADALAAAQNPEMLRLVGSNAYEKPKWAVIGHDIAGNPQYGWVNSNKQTITAPGGVESAGIGYPKGPDGLPLTGEALQSHLEKTDPTAAAMIAAIRRGDAGVTGRNLQKYMPIAQLVDPTLSQFNFDLRKKTALDFAPSGKSANNVKSLETVGGHIEKMMEQFDKLGNTWQPEFNTFKNWLSVRGGKGDLTSFDTYANGVSNELGTVFRSAGMSDAEVKSWRDKISGSASPQQFNDNMSAVLDMLKTRKEALVNQYQQGLGKPPPEGMFAKMDATIGKLEKRLAPQGPLPTEPTAPQRVQQNGWIYERQPDGKMKPVQRVQ